MIKAKLIKSLERKGFYLEFPDYDSNEEVIIEIIKSGEERLKFSIPLLLTEKIDYKKIIYKLGRKEREEINKIIILSRGIYKKENIGNGLSVIIKENKIQAKYSKNEFNDYYSSFVESRKRAGQDEQKAIEEQSKLRLNLDLNKSLRELFSPAKIRIMDKIFNHKKITNTELKYYYRGISKINRAVLTPALQDYLRVIENTRKLI